jgi:hypothetical protein
MDEYIIKKDSLIELADIIRYKFEPIEEDINLIGNRAQFNMQKLPNDITTIGHNAFRECTNLALTSLPESLTSIGDYAFYRCTNLALTSLPAGITNIGTGAFQWCENLKTLTFKGTPQTISQRCFASAYRLETINVPWSEGAVANAPWGATNATINYNYNEVV